MATDLPRMTVGQLRRALADLPADLEVKCWLPGTRIALHQAFVNTPPDGKPVVLIEGNIEPGSALDR